MPFMDEINAVRDKLPANRLPHPVLLGIVMFAVIATLLAVLGVASTARGDFVMGNSASSSLAAIQDASNEDAQTTAAFKSSESLTAHSEDEAAHECYVYVVGAVKEPGVYRLDGDARVIDAVDAAGGLTRKADETAVNLARVIVDGEQITIPVKGEGLEGGSSSAEVAVGAETPTATGVMPDGRVNVNSATAEELQSLPGIGEATAAKIVASRESEGAFSAPEDLTRVSGIGEKKLAAIIDLIVV